MKFASLHLKITLVFTLLIILSASAQKKDTTSSDTVSRKPKIDFVSKMQLFAKTEAKKSIDEFERDKATIAQTRIFEEIKKTMQKAKVFLKNGIDTIGTKKELNIIEKNFVIAGDGVLTDKGSAQTFRNLTATSKILGELLNKSNVIKLRLDNYQSELSKFRYDLDSLLSRPDLFVFPKDSTVLARYLQEIVVVAYQVNPIDSALSKSSLSTMGMLNQVNLEVFKIQSSLEEIERDKLKVATKITDRDFENIWGKVGYYRPFNEVFSQAKAKGWLNFVFYFQNNSGKMLIMFLLIAIAYVYLKSLKGIYITNKLITENYDGQLVLRYPLFSSVLIVITLFQFIFFSSPFVLDVIFWVISAICLSIIFRKFITRYWMRIWLLMVILFFISAADNLILQASRTERWIMLAMSLTGAIAGIIIILKGKKEELKEKLILISISFMIVIEIASTLTNIFGRYNLSKSLLISGYLNVVIAILFLWTIRLINEGLFLAFNVYTKQDLKLFYLNFNKVGKKVPTIFYVLLVLGWGVLFGRNFAGFEYASTPISEFFSTERVVGDYTFTINSLLLFIVIMTISVVISKIVSFFASDKRLSDENNKTALQNVGSWLLLIRIAILSLGLFLAIAAAGIPVDRIAIILGALGVGIGFGLQALVNNLVSGLIIAFEKPVNVGDIVEVDGQKGTMKSIGFRSSVISTWDGADVIMPNGDLLNSHLTNWSMGGSKRRNAISIGVAYNTDLQIAKDTLLFVLDSNPNILKNPAPVALFEQFGSSSIDVNILFWTKKYSDGGHTKSDVIVAIHTAFKAAAIEIAYPRQDITILSDKNTPDL